jgi:hypothetical protein
MGTVMRIIQDISFETLEEPRRNLPQLIVLVAYAPVRPLLYPRFQALVFCKRENIYEYDKPERKKESRITNMEGGGGFGTNIRGMGERELETNRNTAKKMRKGELKRSP